MRKKLFSMLALLCLTAVGAWAQTEQTVDVPPVTGKTNQWTLAMPAGNVVLHVEYEPELTATFKAANALTIEAGKATVSVTENGQPVTTATLADGKLSPLYQGQTVILTAQQGYKFRKVEAEKKAAAAPSVSFTVKRVDHKHADGNYIVAPGTTWQQFIESGDAPACLSIGTSGIYSGKVCHDMNNSLQDCGGTIIANVADKKRVKASDAIIDGATYGCSDYCDYEDHD